MKTKILPAIFLFVFVAGICTSLQAIDVNQQSGILSLHSEYVDNMSQE